ncbi:MAG: hypothetical protein KIS86_09975 [Devosia sp.]|nr:hypothetical protein [Devosia sp.]
MPARAPEKGGSRTMIVHVGEQGREHKKARLCALKRQLPPAQSPEAAEKSGAAPARNAPTLEHACPKLAPVPG